MTTIINLVCGPGGGKSTSAAYLFADLKSRNFNAELVREYAKDWAWERRGINTYDQFYLTGKQIRKESMLYGKVDYIVTDAPVMLCYFYANEYSPPEVKLASKYMVQGFYNQARADGHQHHFVYLKRSKPYNPAGRFQDEEEARKLDDRMRVTVEAMSGGEMPVIETSQEALAWYLEDLLRVTA